jgi:hypothetical protein
VLAWKREKGREEEELFTALEKRLDFNSRASLVVR